MLKTSKEFICILANFLIFFIHKTRDKVLSFSTKIIRTMQTTEMGMDNLILNKMKQFSLLSEFPKYIPTIIP